MYIEFYFGNNVVAINASNQGIIIMCVDDISAFVFSFHILLFSLNLVVFYELADNDVTTLL